MSQQQLHEKTAIDPSSMVAVIDELEARGLAERRPDPDDRRVRTIFLTQAGIETLARVRGVAAQLHRELFRVLSEEELRTLHVLLLKLADGLSPEEGSGPVGGDDHATAAGEGQPDPLISAG
jgi:DNA-binding MarR family transcriptional regulator